MSVTGVKLHLRAANAQDRALAEKRNHLLHSPQAASEGMR